MGDPDYAVYTMRELGQRAGEILREIRKSGRPAFVTSHGRFIAVISPLEPAQVERMVLSGIARGVPDLAGR